MSLNLTTKQRQQRLYTTLCEARKQADKLRVYTKPELPITLLVSHAKHKVQ